MNGSKNTKFDWLEPLTTPTFITSLSQLIILARASLGQLQLKPEDRDPQQDLLRASLNQLKSLT